MRLLRPHLRFCVAAWLLFQMATLSALVPQDCCAAHQPAEASAVNGHSHAAGGGTDGVQCPMRSPDGTPCPMHAGGAVAGHGQHGHAPSLPPESHPAESPPTHNARPHASDASDRHARPTHAEHGSVTSESRTPAATCAFRGDCAGPMAALVALLSQHGVLAGSSSILPEPQSSSAALDSDTSLISRHASLDPPPPRP